MAQGSPDDVEAIQRITGSVFRLIREDAGLELDEVAAYLGVKVEDLGAHEAGKDPLTTAKLYQAGLLFGVKISAFFQPFYHPELYERED
jgi:transcriptional regulator with XRE-family HTH domain